MGEEPIKYFRGPVAKTLSQNGALFLELAFERTVVAASKNHGD